MPELPTQDPSRLIGNTGRHPAEELHAAMADVVPINNLPEEVAAEAFAAYVDARASELAKDDMGESVGNAARTEVDTFIGPNTMMLNSAWLDKAYHLDDNAAYAEAYPTFRTAYKNLLDRLGPEKGYINAAVAGVNTGQAVYFQSYRGDMAKRVYAVGDFVDDSATDVLSIARYKGVAICQERAAVAHNTLRIFGIDSKFESGYIRQTHEDGSFDQEKHAYVVVTNSENEKFLFDPTNPIVHRDSDGAIKGIQPAVYKINDPEADHQVVQLKEYVAAEDGSSTMRTQELTYYFGMTPPDERLS